MSTTISRRRFALAIAGTTAALAAPAAALDRLMQPYPPMLAEGHVKIGLGARVYTVDTADLPELRVDTLDDPELPAWLGTDTVSIPKPGLYLVLTHDGRLMVSELCEGSALGTSGDRRQGHLPAVADGPMRMVSPRCTVLGRVIGEVAA